CGSRPSAPCPGRCGARRGARAPAGGRRTAGWGACRRSAGPARSGRGAPARGHGSRPLSLRSAFVIEAVVTHHRHGFRSGVARFNELLAGRLGVPLRGLDEPWPATALLSFKVGELSDAERETVGRKLDGWAGAVY